MTRYILRWEEGEHPVIAELRSQPGRWAVINESGVPVPDDYPEANMACVRHPRVEVQTHSIVDVSADLPTRYVKRARWIPDTEWCCCRGGR